MKSGYTLRAKVRPDTSRRRATVVAVFLCCWMLVIGARLVQLQTSQHEWLSRRARAQQLDAEPVNPPRGLILDRAGRELARSIDVNSYFAVPGEVEDIDGAAARLANVLRLDAGGLATRIRQAKEAGRRFVWLARKVSDEQSRAVEDLKLKGIYAQQESKRRYPNNELASHILGFVGLDEKGLAGVEQFYNTALTGDAGRLLYDADARRRAYESSVVAARPGHTVVLTIDQIVQYQVEQALVAAVERARAKSGTAIVLEPHTGEILALANAPSFNPNDVSKSEAETRANDALQNIYEPGSTFKIVAYSAALEEKLARPDDRIDCQMGSINVAGRIVHDHSPYGSLTMTEALAKSSNVAAIKLGLRVGDARMYDYIRSFGFGQRTGIELPGETVGLVRPVKKWQPTSMGSVAIGQEVGVTPLQMAGAFAALANDGVRVAPHIVREVRDEEGRTIEQAQAETHRVISTDTARTVRQMLEMVTLKGTAKAAQLDGYTAAGKTGTAQKIDPQTRTYSATKHVASFAGFAPVERPALVIIVVIDEPVGAYHGGDVAAPVFREIADRVLPYLDVAPDEEPEKPAAQGRLLAQNAPAHADAVNEAEAMEAGPQVSLPQVAETRAGRGEMGEVVYAAAAQRALLMPDLRGRSLRDAARICAQLGLELEARGEGRALKQFPQVGASIESGQTVRIEFGRSD